MPSIAAHMIVGKLVSDKLNINDNNFIKGNLLPDIIDIKDSHHKIKGENFLIPDIDYFKRTLDLKNNLYLGYLTHLLLDKYFLEEYVPEYIKNLNVFEDKIIYREYDLVNYTILKKFNIDVDKLSSILSNYNVKINQEKLEYNLKSLNNKEVGETTYLKIDEFSTFLYNISDRISKEIKEYACKSNKLFIHTR